MRFVDSLDLPVIAALRDSQNFVDAAEKGIGIHEMEPSQVRRDLEQLERIARWLDGWPERRQAAKDIQRCSFSKVSYLHKRQADLA